MTDDEYFDFCQRNRKLRIERTAAGQIVVMAPVGGETSYRNLEVAAQLGVWANGDGRGIGFDSSAAFLLSDGSALSPDASWISRVRLDGLTKAEKQKFMRMAPEFVIELKSPSDRLAALQRKMQNWIANGVELGWLIHADRRTVYIYRARREVEELGGVMQVRGEGPVDGFVLGLGAVWAGL
jgi:Uma2 family endonuclease